MSIREDFWKRVNGEKTELIPWFGDLSYYYDSLKRRGMLDAKYEGTEGEISFYRDRRVGICFYAPQTFTVEYNNGISFEEKEVKDGIHSVFHTKYGDLTSFMCYLPESYTHAYREHYIKSIEDLKIMAHIFENTRYLPNYEPFHERDRMYGEEGLAVELGPISVAPIQMLLARWAGVEKTVELFFDETDEFEDCIESIGQSQLPVFDIMAGSGAKVTEFAENISSEISGSFFKRYSLPYYKQVNEILHKAGKLTGVHIDGTLKPLLGKLHEAGFDFGEAVTPKPVGDISLEKLRELAGPDLIIWGGLPGAMFTPVFSDAEFEEHINRVLAVDDGKMVLGVADQVPPDGIDERIRHVSEIIGRG